MDERLSPKLAENLIKAAGICILLALSAACSPVVTRREWRPVPDGAPGNEIFVRQTPQGTVYRTFDRDRGIYVYKSEEELFGGEALGPGRAAAKMNLDRIIRENLEKEEEILAPFRAKIEDLPSKGDYRWGVDVRSFEAHFFKIRKGHELAEIIEYAGKPWKIFLENFGELPGRTPVFRLRYVFGDPDSVEGTYHFADIKIRDDKAVDVKRGVVSHRR